MENPSRALMVLRLRLHRNGFHLIRSLLRRIGLAERLGRDGGLRNRFRIFPSFRRTHRRLADHQIGLLFQDFEPLRDLCHHRYKLRQSIFHHSRRFLRCFCFPVFHPIIPFNRCMVPRPILVRETKSLRASLLVYFFFFAAFFEALGAGFFLLEAAGGGVLSSLTCAGTTMPEMMSLGT